ncbi:MAG: response regulator transcription factor [Endomicrobium sp.]|jgi:two-component system phosphate regulon response regulator PhoB/two-component system alkaline phosphatase synthesis response regulator PhoP|nr:response regulator transcription factor [Endomicrobium sp.]
MNNLIYVVDDEEDILELVEVHLKKNFFKVRTFASSFSFFKALEKQKPGLAILDIMMPRLDGIEVAKIMKKNPEFAKIPIIFLSARGDESDKITGLEIGADDYVSKPFSVKELIARIKVVLRRTNGWTSDEKDKSETESRAFQGVKIDKEKFAAFSDGKKIDLTVTEFKILELFLSKPDAAFSRERILDYLWGGDKLVIDRTIDVHIKNLREKLGKNGALIKNIRGVGYKLEK